MDGKLLRRDCSISICSVAKTLEPISKGVSEVAETCSLVRMIIWGEMDGLLLSHDCFVKIGNRTETFRPTLEQVSEVVEICKLVRVTIWS
jgi:hypothetical protein